MRSISATSGVVLDPFSILVSGIMRRHWGAQRQQSFDALHGEAKFKQAFVNACYFAESMTVVGPIAQFHQYDMDSLLESAICWAAPYDIGDNQEFFNQLKQFAQANNLDKVKHENIFGDSSSLTAFLHLMPDVTLNASTAEWQGSAGLGVEYYVFEQLFGDKWNNFNRHALIQRNGLSEYARQGTPVSAFMAVVFTFKKPVGNLAVNELTNLAGWPPVVFLLPVLVPAFTTIIDEDTYHTPYQAAVWNQPAVMSYQIRIPKGGNGTLPYGQPYRLKTVNSFGKEPDTLRSLSDVFKALWSQAAQYSAWNFRFHWNQTNPKATPILGELALDPIGAGRRIRGHNRFSGRYEVEALSMLWENRDNSDFGLWAWDTNRASTLADASSSTRADLFLRQLRLGPMMSSGKKEFLFVFPSYFQPQVSKDFLPTAMTLTRWLMVNRAGLEDFLDTNIVVNSYPGEGKSTPEELRTNVNLLGDNRGHSFAHRLAEALHLQDQQSVGALPVRRVKTPIGFDKTGDPTVFGLSIERDACLAMETHQLGKSAPISDESLEMVIAGTQVQENFKFLDAFCSKNTKDLTDVFATMSKKAIKEMKTKGYVDESMVVNLFDDLL